MNDDHLYFEVTEEVTNGKIDPALWAKAIAKALGDEEKGKYEYINLRVEQIKTSPQGESHTQGDERYMPKGASSTSDPNSDESDTDPEIDFVVTDNDESSDSGSPTDMESESDGVFHKLIQGKYGLAKTYWGFWFGVMMIMYIISIVIEAEGTPTMALSWYAIRFGYSVILWIAIWRSATRYSGSIIWAGLAKFAVVLGILLTFGQVWEVFNPIY